ncbi:MAG: hypothetical protein R8M46_05715 [Ghiorsea sp.]
MSFWFKPRQIIVMDAHGGRPARNFYLRTATLVVFLLLLAGIPFALGAYYAPFHSIQKIIPENLQLKRANKEILRNLADANTLNDLKDEQIEGFKEQINVREREALDLTKQLHMFKSILGQRKGKGIQIVSNKANWVAGTSIEWQSLFVKGGTYPRYLVGSYKLFALDAEGNKIDLNKAKMSYRFESHAVINQVFEWSEAWTPVELELVIYNSRRKEVLKQTIQIQGR